jgi:hypothetical protein
MDHRVVDRAAGIQLVAGAPRAGTLTFGDNNTNYLEIANTPRYAIASLAPKTACRIALARLVEIDKLVPMAKADPPSTCEPVGSAQGVDEGWLDHGSVEAAVIEAQFKVRAQGGNLFVQDVAREDQTKDSTVRIDGRGFRCAQ